MAAIGLGVLLFVGLTIGSFIVGFVLYAGMNFFRMTLTILLRGLGVPGPDRQWNPSSWPWWARLLWNLSGVITLTTRYSLRTWWPVLLASLVLTVHFMGGN